MFKSLSLKPIFRISDSVVYDLISFIRSPQAGRGKRNIHVHPNLTTIKNCDHPFAQSQISPSPPKRVCIRDVLGEDTEEGRGEAEFLNDLFTWVIEMAAEQAQDDVEPLVSFVKTCAILFSVQHYIQITKLQIKPL